MTVHRFPERTDADRYCQTLKAVAAGTELAVPAVVGDFDEWLVTARPGGVSAELIDRHPDPDDLVAAVGRALAALHDAAGEPAAASHAEPAGWDLVVDRCHQAVDRGLVRVDQLPDPYARYQPAELLELLVSGRPDPAGDAEHLVWCHGHPSVDRFLVDGGRPVGMDGFEWSLVADRHLDLAVTHQSVQAAFGPEAVFRFYDAYGRDPDLARLEHHVLAGHLLAGLTGSSW